MKKLITFLLFISFIQPCVAQNTFSVMGTDSMRMIELQELFVSSIKKSPQQQLIHFYKSNSASTLEDILSRLPELSLQRRGAYGMEPSIRYFNGGQINVLVDGMRIHGACTDKMDPATIYIEPINLQQLQVQTAGSGFMNGSSIGGTLNMKMAESDYLHSNKLTGVFSSGYQTAAKSIYESLRLNYSTGKWALAASGTYRNNQNYKSGGGQIIPFSQYKKTNYSLSVKYRQNKYTYLKADVLADDGWNIGYAALPMDVGYAAARIGSLSLHWENSTKQLYKMQTKIYANTVRHFMDDTKRPNVPMHMDMPGESKTIGIYSEGELRLKHQQKLLLRADVSSTYLKASMTMYQVGQPSMYMLTWPDNRKNQMGISASWLWQLDSLWRLQLTGRTDLITSKLVSPEAKNQVNIFSNSFNGRTDFLKNISAQVSKKINRKLNLNAVFSYSERLPSPTELFGMYLFNSSDGYDYVGNTELKSEKSLQAELSFNYNWYKNRVQLNGYYSRVANFIIGNIDPALSAMTIGAHAVKTYVNIPYAIVAGAEVTGFFNPFASVNLVSTIRYNLAEDNYGDPLPFVAPLKNINSVRYQPNQFSVQLESETSLKQNKVSSQYGEDVTAGYFLLNMRFGYDASIFKNKAEIQSGVENIFDKKYHDHLDWGNIPRPGRNFYIQLKIIF